MTFFVGDLREVGGGVSQVDVVSNVEPKWEGGIGTKTRLIEQFSFKPIDGVRHYGVVVLTLSFLRS